MTRVLEALAAGLLLAAWLFAIQTIPALPAIVPTHYGPSGEPNATGSKAMLWLLPAIATITFAVFAFRQRRPNARMNLPVKITDRNRDAVHALAREMQPALNVTVLLSLLGAEWGTIDGAARGSLSPYFYPAVFVPVALIVAILIVYTVRMRSA